ncbi:AAA family ATPase, partial [Bacteroides caecigallinarum]|uniref:AAA family ATPase n=1 Tax=Bacteroides caecigallinarum TaxID=1411144 RepID=UPI00195E9951
KVYPVFHMDFNGGNFTEKGVLEKWIGGYISSWERETGFETDSEQPLGLRFMEILKFAHEQSGHRAVVLVDEYDKPILDVLDVDKNLEEEHRNILKGFYSVFKGADEHLQF